MGVKCLVSQIIGLFLVSSQVTAQMCKEGWHYYDNSCYGFGGAQITWGDAQEICLAFNAKLAEIETEVENSFLKNLVKNKQADQTWIGGTDILEEGIWKWVSASQQIFSFTDWADNQPDEYEEDEDCLSFSQSGNYQWNDRSCSSLANFICESKTNEVIVG